MQLSYAHEFCSTMASVDVYKFLLIFLNPISPDPWFCPGEYNLPFLNRILEGEGRRFRGYEIYINEGKFDEFYV